MKIIHRHKSRNFTGDDLSSAEIDMNNAWKTYQSAVSDYNISALSDPGSYNSRKKKTVLDSTKDQYDIAKTRYDDMLKDIQSANEVDYAAAQQAAVKQTLADQVNGTATKKDYSTYIYIGVGLVVLLLIIKS